MTYCAKDVGACWEIFAKLWPEFKERFPSLVTFIGMLEMGKSYLPITDNFETYISRSESECDQLEKETRKILTELVSGALELLKNGKYKTDAWLWDEDWSIPICQGKSLPKWYRDLNKGGTETGPKLVISGASQIVPKLLKLSWGGYPLFYTREDGWGFLIPDKQENEKAVRNGDSKSFRKMGEDGSSYEVLSEKAKTWVVFPFEMVCKAAEKADKKVAHHLKETGKKLDRIPGCFFHKLPHPNGGNLRVGTPLSKDFLKYIESGQLTSENPKLARKVAENAKLCHYWHNNRDRILGQSRYFLRWDYLPEPVKSAVEKDPEWKSRKIGTLLPQVIVAGTVTRRGVERTWMTASNPRSDRVGSELKALSEAPPGYSFVGADVDSQEQWIAALLGDKYKNQHKAGSTEFSQMLLLGSKKEGTDLHSTISKQLGITRDQAKILNYGRLYGAGLPFAGVLLKQFIPSANERKLKTKAQKLYTLTKGKRNWKTRLWEDGYESDVFNCLEETVRVPTPRTPVLNCAISKSLSVPGQPDQFLPSKINWVVQSSAVDFLHLLLSCMLWLCTEYQIDARYALSIHDEIRYVVRNEDRYRCALALQLSNMFTRAMFSHCMDIPELPLSVAYFTQVDIDKVMRKEANLECVTPSNPRGMSGGYNIGPGEALDINEILSRTGGSLERVGENSQKCLGGRDTEIGLEEEEAVKSVIC